MTKIATTVSAPEEKAGSILSGSGQGPQRQRAVNTVITGKPVHNSAPWVLPTEVHSEYCP